MPKCPLQFHYSIQMLTIKRIYNSAWAIFSKKFHLYVVAFYVLFFVQVMHFICISCRNYDCSNLLQLPHDSIDNVETVFSNAMMHSSNLVILTLLSSSKASVKPQLFVFVSILFFYCLDLLYDIYLSNATMPLLIVTCAYIDL